MFDPSTSDAFLQFMNEFPFEQSNLVSDDQPGHLNASIQDPNLVNPWGVAFSPTGPFWVNNNHSGTATIYDVDPTTNATAAAPLVVAIASPQAVFGATAAVTPFLAPTGGSSFLSPSDAAELLADWNFKGVSGLPAADQQFIFGQSRRWGNAFVPALWNSQMLWNDLVTWTPGAQLSPFDMASLTIASPTGIVFNSDQNGFMVNGNPATFIVDTEDGTISAWNGGASTTLEVDNSANAALGDPNVALTGAVYKGLAIGTQTDGTTLLYATNFRHGTVDVFNSQWQQVNSLTDSGLPAGYAPFNAQVLDGNLFVTYAKQDPFKHDDVAGPGNGFVDEFSLSGELVAHVASNGPLNSPWGMAIAPADFGQFAGDLLVGNFGDGTINAFDLKTDQFVGTLNGVDGKPIAIGDLWTLTPGNGGSAGSSGEIFFTSGVQGESSGLFGAIAPVPGHSNAFMVT